ncbi:uncharacterized protein LOC143262641 [Megalopta genalis]|uniref:uncharacterized protein LOC143262641 n=1 Tax=Megalopta genalis TaxID=115081 RepID=UPI003FD4B9E2
MVERLHRQLKAAIRCYDTDDWTEALPLILLGIRTAVKEDIQTTPAEMVYGSNLRLPGEFFMSNPETDISEFVNQLRHKIQKLKPRPATNHGHKSIFVHKDLGTTEYVFLRHDAVKSPLQSPYDGPYKVLKRGDKNFTIRVGSQEKTVSIDRLKPAHIALVNMSAGIWSVGQYL